MDGEVVGATRCFGLFRLFIDCIQKGLHAEKQAVSEQISLRLYLQLLFTSPELLCKSPVV